MQRGCHVLEVVAQARHDAHAGDDDSPATLRRPDLPSADAEIWGLGSKGRKHTGASITGCATRCTRAGTSRRESEGTCTRSPAMSEAASSKLNHSLLSKSILAVARVCERGRSLTDEMRELRCTNLRLKWPAVEMSFETFPCDADNGRLPAAEKRPELISRRSRLGRLHGRGRG